MSDKNLVSKEDHELETILKRYGKRTTEANKDILSEAIDDFKDDEHYSPHNRENFYLYLETSDYFARLEDKY